MFVKQMQTEGNQTTHDQRPDKKASDSRNSHDEDADRAGGKY